MRMRPFGRRRSTRFVSSGFKDVRSLTRARANVKAAVAEERQDRRFVEGAALLPAPQHALHLQPGVLLYLRWPGAAPVLPASFLLQQSNMRD